MNKRTRLIVSLLFAVMIILAAAITQFYVSVPKDKQNDKGQDEIVKVVSTDSSGYYIFGDGKGSFGIAESGRITAAPEWRSLEFAGNDLCIAEKKLGGQIRVGCIDYDGNVAVPLVYKEIKRLTSGGISLYCAVSAEDGSCVVYDDSFSPKSFRSWKACTAGNEEFTFTDEYGEFVYSAGYDGLLFKRASLSGEIAGSPYSLSISSRVMLSKLTPYMIERMAEDAGKYIEYGFSGDESLLENITRTGTRNFPQLFAGAEEVSSKKPLSVSDVHIYFVRSEDDVPWYEVSARVDAEIVYTDEAGAKKTMTVPCKAAVRFSGSSDGTLKILSGTFDPEKPEYPAEEPTENPTDSSEL